MLKPVQTINSQWQDSIEKQFNFVSLVRKKDEVKALQAIVRQIISHEKAYQTKKARPVRRYSEQIVLF